MYKKLYLIFTALIFATLLHPAKADILFTNKGDEIDGKLEKVEKDKIHFKVKDKNVKIYDKKDILKVMVLLEKKIEGEDKASQIKDKELTAFLNKLPTEKEYPDAGYLTYLYEKTYILNKDRSSTKTTKIIKYIFKERAREQGNVKVAYLTDREKADILYARAINKDEIFYVNDTAIQDASEYYYYPQYDKIQSIKFSIPNVNIGTVIDYSTKVECKKHDIEYPFFGEMYFRFTEPVATGRLNVIIPSGIKINFKEFNMPGGVSPTITNMGDKTKYCWEVKNSKSYVYENSMPPANRVLPYVTFGIEDSWDAIQKHFGKVLEQQLIYDDALKAKIAELTKNASNDTQKVEAVYNWLVKEIKSIGIGMDDYSYIPKSSAEVFKIKTANGLDKAFLYYAMLKYAGIKADFVYSVDKYDAFVKELPSIRQFVNVGVLVNINNKPIVITPYDDTLRYDDQTASLQDSDYVIFTKAYNEKTSVSKTPLNESDKDSSLYNVKMSLDKDGNIFISAEGKFTGESQSNWRGYKNYTPQERDKSMEQLVNDIHTNAVLESYTLDNLDDLTKDIVYRIKYNIKDYALTAGGKYLIFKIPNMDYSAYDVGKPSREFPLFWTNKYKITSDIEIILPGGYKIYYLPQPINLKTKRLNFERIYNYENGKIICKDIWIKDTLEIQVSEYGDYKKEKEKLARYSQEWIVLQKVE